MVFSMYKGSFALQLFGTEVILNIQSTECEEIMVSEQAARVNKYSVK